MTHNDRRPCIAMMNGTDGPGGAEMMVFRLSEELRNRGFSVIPVGPAKGIGWLGDVFRNAGFRPEACRLSGKWIDTQCMSDLMRIFRAHDVDLVHSHEFDMAVYGAATARIFRVPHLITMHGGLTVTKARRRRIALRMAMSLSHTTVAVSQATQRQFANDLGIREAAFTVVPNGVPFQAGNASMVRDEFACGADDTVILAVGTLELNKGHHILIDALSRANQDGKERQWKLIIAGGRGGDQQEPLAHRVRELGLDEKVRIVTNRNDIPDLQALSDIFVMPSFWEGLPMALLEAMVAGKAIIASSTGGIPEAIVDGRDGILVPPGDIDALANALRIMLDDPVRRGAYAAAASARGRREFTVQAMADRYEALYERSGWRT